jgi:hypothetical protein
MSTIITKVKNNASGKCKESKNIGWGAVLSDIRHDIAQLSEFARIVERKIERGEQWPGQSRSTATQ